MELGSDAEWLVPVEEPGDALAWLRRSDGVGICITCRSIGWYLFCITIGVGNCITI